MTEEKLKTAIIENYEEWSREVKLLRDALMPFSKIDIRMTFEGYVPGALISVGDVERAKRAISETDP